MTPEQVARLEPGLYSVLCADGHQRLAAVGRGNNSRWSRWIAPVETSGSTYEAWAYIQSVTPIAIQPHGLISVVGQDITIDGSKMIESARRST